MTDHSSQSAATLEGRFEVARPRLRHMARRMLGSATECEDALQESWLRVSRADVTLVTNLEGWLTTVVARVCLDTLNWRESRREDLTPDDPRRDVARTLPGDDPEEEAMLADSIGVAMTILLDTLQPAERVAFVLHDMFDVPFDDIAPIVGRTTEATRQLASRARRRVRGGSAKRDGTNARREELVRAFLAASRAGNFSGLLALLDPGATLRGDAAIVAMGGAAFWESDHLEAGIVGAEAVARRFSGRASAARQASIDGEPGAVWMHGPDVRVAFRFTLRGERIVAIDLIADPVTLAQAVIET